MNSIVVHFFVKWKPPPSGNPDFFLYFYFLCIYLLSLFVTHLTLRNYFFISLALPPVLFRFTIWGIWIWCKIDFFPFRDLINILFSSFSKLEMLFLFIYYILFIPFVNRLQNNRPKNKHVNKMGANKWVKALRKILWTYFFPSSV